VRNTDLAAISVDSPEESRKLCQGRGYTFPFLSDPKAETIRAYGVLHPQGGVDGHDIARPAEFLVDKNGTIVWENLAPSIIERLRPENALAAIDRM
jgi:peroxiredoxin